MPNCTLHGLSFPTSISNYILHPAILDSALHILVHPAITGNRDKGRYYLPAKIGTFAIHDTLLQNPFPAKVYTHATFVKWTPGESHVSEV